jgi:hypothetical protein
LRLGLVIYREQVLWGMSRGDLKLFYVYKPQAQAKGYGNKLLKGLILAQNERWRRGLGMQVERETLGNWGGKWRKGQ